MSKFKKSILTLFRISFTEFRRWIRNSRLIILGAMLVFIHMLIITPLKELKSPEEYITALSPYKNIQSLKIEISFSLEQIQRINKKKDALRKKLNQFRRRLPN